MRLRYLTGALVLTGLGTVIGIVALSHEERVPDHPVERIDSSMATTPEVVPPDEVDPVVDAAAEGLSAWGRMAASGDVAHLRGTFDVGGPQYRSLREWRGVGGAPYRVELTPVRIARDREQALIGANVEWSRPGEPSRIYSWVIEMRRRGGDWRLWTIHEG